MAMSDHAQLLHSKRLLFQSCAENDDGEVKRVLAQLKSRFAGQVQWESLRDSLGNSVFQIAARNGDKALLCALEEQLKDVMDIESELKYSNEGRGTALHFAVVRESYSVCQELIRLGESQLQVKNQFGLTPLDLAKSKKMNRIVLLFERRLERNSDPKNHVVRPASQEEMQKLSKLQNPLEISVEMNAKSKCTGEIHSKWKCGTSEDREKQLLNACVRGDLESIKHLHSLKVSFLCCDMENNQPLHLAAWNGHLHVVKFLIDIGVSRQPRNVNGWTPLHFAMSNGSLSLCKYLCEEIFLSLESKSNLEMTPLYYAKNPAVKKYFARERERITQLQNQDISDRCVNCRIPLSKKFGDSLEAVPKCIPTHKRKLLDENIRYAHIVNANHETIRPVFDPFDSNVSLFQSRFGSYSNCFCKYCQKSGKFCRCAEEKTSPRDLRIRKVHIPVKHIKMRILYYFSKSSEAGKLVPRSPLIVLKSSPIFDFNLIENIFEFL